MTVPELDIDRRPEVVTTVELMTTVPELGYRSTTRGGDDGEADDDGGAGGDDGVRVYTFGRKKLYVLKSYDYASNVYTRSIIKVVKSEIPQSPKSSSCNIFLVLATMSHCSNKHQQKMMLVKEQKQHNKMMATLAKNNKFDGDKEEDTRDLEEMFSKLNPMAQEFVPHHTRRRRQRPSSSSSSSAVGGGHATATSSRRKGNNSSKKSNGNGKRLMNSRTGKAQKDDAIKRTVYVSNLHHLVTEAQVADLFVYCGQVVDCRVCGDPKSPLRFAFIEFTDLEGAENALTLSGTMLGHCPIKVLPSKTAIAPVNPTFLPRSQDEMEVCARTIYCTNIDRKVTQRDLKFFFESFCGEVYHMRMLEDPQHHHRIAFVEFAMAESATVALRCSGALVGSLPIRWLCCIILDQLHSLLHTYILIIWVYVMVIRVSPSKTAVRPRSTCPTSC
ncbi:Ataxin-2, C-terminal [Artemisia annua]|uniref:Ataxin-2, C-terminal n=1 Tax=Artemisia annua TaxID=35608 RepID=A0A2U1NAL2_ARTAN|nr:Ataxin-2, C-terminal [Artemisia annua]